MNTLSLNMRLLLLLLATTAHALLHSVKLGGPSPAAWFQDTLGIGTDGDGPPSLTLCSNACAVVSVNSSRMVTNVFGGGCKVDCN